MTTITASGPDFSATVARFTDELGFRLELITPADDPGLAVLSRGDITVEIRRDGAPVEIERPMVVPTLAPALEICPADEADWVTGRAGMRYRDLIPSRLGGRFIASNIEVCDGGPVPDQVHHHAIRFQLIFCERGWVDVVYEDQGPEFRMHAGDAVLQPPHIRHRVLASSAGARVVEIGCPAEHDTLFDHELSLPTAAIDPDRLFGDQRFVHHVGADVPWQPIDGGFERQTSDIADATGGLADVFVMRSVGGTSLAPNARDGEFDFGFVLAGSARFHIDGSTVALDAGASFSLPAGAAWQLDAVSPDFRLLRVCL